MNQLIAVHINIKPVTLSCVTYYDWELSLSCGTRYFSDRGGFMPTMESARMAAIKSLVRINKVWTDEGLIGTGNEHDWENV